MPTLLLCVLTAHALPPAVMMSPVPEPVRVPAALPSDTAPASASYRTEEVRYERDDLTLAALLMLPETEGPHPGAVVIRGSGGSDRSNPWTRAVAEEILGAGVAVLLTDKRGSGASEGDWRAADFHDLAGDAMAGVRYLRSRPEIRGSAIGLVGLSQGGRVAPIAASRSGKVAFVVNVSGSAVSFLEQSFHEMGNMARQAGLPESAVREVLALNRAAGEFLLTGNWAPYDRARARGLATPWRQIAEGFPASPDAEIWTFLRGVASYSPLPYWAQVTVPVLVLYGEADERDNVPVKESVRRLEYAFGLVGKEDARIVVIPGAGHGFIDHGRHGLMPAFRGALGGWLKARTGG